MLPAFMAAVLAWSAGHYFAMPRRSTLLLGAGAAALAVALFVCTGMIYSRLRFLQEWHTPLTPLLYALLGCASGLTAAAALAAALHPALVPPYVAAAL